MVTFGVQIEPQFGYTYDEVVAAGQACEAFDFATLTTSDHFMLREDSVGVPSLECWSLLAALAVELKTVRLGPLVSCTSYRSPALLAKVAATVDVLSQGRLEFALGAGWKKLEYDAYGYPFPRFAERVVRMEEALEIVKRMWTEDSPSFEGRHYTIQDAVCEPKPTQDPRPPVWVGGGSDQVLQAAVRHADGVNIPFKPLEAFRERVEAVRGFCEEDGRDFDDLQISTFIWTLVGRENQLDQIVTDFAKTLNIPVERIRAMGENGFLGPPEELANRLAGYVEAGAHHLILGFAKGWEPASIELVHDEVARALG